MRIRERQTWCHGGVESLLNPEQQGLNNGERQWQFQPERGSLAELGFQAHGSLQAVQHALHDVHADAAPGNFGDLLGRAEAGTEDVIQGFGFRELGEFFRRRQPEFDGLGANLLDIDAASVVGNREHDVAVPAQELDADLVPAVLERVLEQLAEDERQRGRARSGERHRLELSPYVLAGREPLQQPQLFTNGMLDAFFALTYRRRRLVWDAYFLIANNSY